ncbi:TPA: hypothetical protein H1016_02620 [archaeon]|uniref:Uncharacterized protein n=1 Tax=Candidatus Naiadarchaeum limnaeum TaxID=2756139 RepID=A0A832XJC7_9ARCH|nr:hypothetical protein [Candidatus Naiadarchaeum limnaeum]
MPRRKSPAQDTLSLRPEFTTIFQNIADLNFFDRHSYVAYPSPYIAIVYGIAGRIPSNIEEAFRGIAAFKNKAHVEVREVNLVLLFKNIRVRDAWLKLFRKIKDERSEFEGVLKSGRRFKSTLSRYKIV